MHENNIFDHFIAIVMIFMTATACLIAVKTVTDGLQNIRESFKIVYSDETDNAQPELIKTEDDSIVDEEEYTVTPSADDTEHNSSYTAQEFETSDGDWFFLVPATGFILLMAGGLIYGLVKHHRHTPVESDDSEMYSQADGSYSAWRQTLRLNIDQLEHKSRALTYYTHEIDSNLKEIIDLCNTIYKETDETEYMSGELSKINTYYLPTLYKLVSSLCQLYKLPETIDMATEIQQTRRQLLETIVASKQVFVNMVHTCLEKDMINMSVEAAVYKQKVAQPLSPLDIKVNS